LLVKDLWRRGFRKGSIMPEGCWDVVVVGAGAAGLLAAIRAAERGRHTLLLEKNR